MAAATVALASAPAGAGEQCASERCARNDARDRRRRRRSWCGYEPGRGAGVCRTRLELFGDPRPLLHRHRARAGTGEHDREGAGRLEGEGRAARRICARGGGGRDALQLAAGGAGGAGGGEPHVRDHLRRGRLEVRRVRRRSLTGVSRQSGGNLALKRGGGRHGGADRHLWRATRDHVLLRKLRRAHRKRAIRIPRSDPASRGWSA